MERFCNSFCILLPQQKPTCYGTKWQPVFCYLQHCQFHPQVNIDAKHKVKDTKLKVPKNLLRYRVLEAMEDHILAENAQAGYNKFLALWTTVEKLNQFLSCFN